MSINQMFGMNITLGVEWLCFCGWIKLYNIIMIFGGNNHECFELHYGTRACI